MEWHDYTKKFPTESGNYLCYLYEGKIRIPGWDRKGEKKDSYRARVLYYNFEDNLFYALEPRFGAFSYKYDKPVLDNFVMYWADIDMPEALRNKEKEGEAVVRGAPEALESEEADPMFK